MIYLDQRSQIFKCIRTWLYQTLKGNRNLVRYSGGSLYPVFDTAEFDCITLLLQACFVFHTIDYLGSESRERKSKSGGRGETLGTFESLLLN